MHAHLQSVRLAPKKAILMAEMVRGLPVPDAVELLRTTSKKSARLFEQLLRSAMANAQHNFKQDAQGMIVKTVFVNKGMYYRRGTPMARGRVRPLKKFLCHITITLGYPEVLADSKGKMKRSKKSERSEGNIPKATSKVSSHPVKDAGSEKPHVQAKTKKSDGSSSSSS